MTFFTLPKASLYTGLIEQLVAAFHAAIPGSEVSVDVAWTEPCIDGRCYQYEEIGRLADAVFGIRAHVRRIPYRKNKNKLCSMTCGRHYKKNKVVSSHTMISEWDVTPLPNRVVKKYKVVHPSL